MIKLLLFSGCYIKLTLHLTKYSVHRANIVCQNSPRSHDDDDDGLIDNVVSMVTRKIECCSLKIRYFHAITSYKSQITISPVCIFSGGEAGLCTL